MKKHQVLFLKAKEYGYEPMYFWDSPTGPKEIELIHVITEMAHLQYFLIKKGIHVYPDYNPDTQFFTVSVIGVKKLGNYVWYIGAMIAGLELGLRQYIMQVKKEVKA